MNFGQNLKAFLRRLPLKKMTGHRKFLAVAAFHSKGKEGAEVATKDVEKQWLRSLLKAKYNPSFYHRAQQEGWVDPIANGKGRFLLTKDGLDHLRALAIPQEDFSEGELEKSGSLIIVNRKGTHSFDKFVRRLLAQAKAQVLIADSYVDGTIFDTVLDVISKTASIRLLYKRRSGNFEQRAKRFRRQYQKLTVKKYEDLHDRFLIIDDTGYVVGPSLKDAASKSPALVVALGGKEKQRLQSFFYELWKKAK
ncbi:MAG: hypothetical protein ACE5HL_07585 [Terriglobia bacterium]